MPSRVARILASIFFFPTVESGLPWPAFDEWILSPVSTIVTSKFPVVSLSSLEQISRSSAYGCCWRKAFSASKYLPYPHPPQYWISRVIFAIWSAILLLSVLDGDITACCVCIFLERNGLITKACSNGRLNRNSNRTNATVLKCTTSIGCRRGSHYSERRQISIWSASCLFDDLGARVNESLCGQRSVYRLTRFLVLSPQ